MDDTFRLADTFGPSRIIHIHRPSVELKAIVVVDNTSCGPAIGGIPLDEIGATGFGLASCVDVAAGFIGLNLGGARVVVQGFGAVGKHAARFLAQKNAILVGASDSKGTLADPAGLDIAALAKLKEEGGSLRDHPRGENLPGDAVIDIDCDIWIPAARPDVVNAGNVARLRTRLVAQGANIPRKKLTRRRACHKLLLLAVPQARLMQRAA